MSNQAFRTSPIAAVALSSACFFSTVAVAADELVVNGGFETGDFSGWTVTEAAQNSSVVVNKDFPLSGSYAAAFGADTPPFSDTIEQGISTQIGTAYRVSFYLDQEVGVQPNSFVASFGGTTFLTLVNAPPMPYTLFSAVVTATSSLTVLKFSSYNVDFYYTLDDVSVAAVPEPETWAMFGVGLAMICIARRRETSNS